jgi:HEAT repeat protein
VCRELTDAERRARIDAYLRTIDVPVDADDWLALGPGAAPLLEAIARDPRALPTRRAQALAALAIVSGPGAAALLGELAAREDEPLAVRLSAVRGLAGVTAAERLLPALRPLLESARDVRIRAAAARGLADKVPDQACAAIQARAAAEDPEPRAYFGPALEACRTLHPGGTTR